MKRRVRALRNAAAQSCGRSGEFRRLMNAGLEEVLEEADLGDWNCQEIAAQTLARCCVANGKFNGSTAALYAVLSFLEDEMGPMEQGKQQAWLDLRANLDSGGSLNALRGWVDTHYA